MTDRQLGGERSPALGRVLVLMALACLAPLAAVALADGDTDADNVTTAGRSSESTPDPGGSSLPGATVPPAPTTGDGAGGGGADDTAGTSTTAATTATTQPSPATGPLPSLPTTGGSTPSPTSPTTSPTTVTPGSAPALAPIDEVVLLANAERAAATPQCGPLRVDGRLTAAAQSHSDDMSAQGYLAHTSPAGTTPRDRAAAAGYGGPVGENIARGYGSAEDVMAAWMASTSHRANILECNYTVIGVGVAADGWYWTQMFGLT